MVARVHVDVDLGEARALQLPSLGCVLRLVLVRPFRLPTTTLAPCAW
jgi:hypothetical protein